MTLRIVATSDTHHKVKDVKSIPDGDVFVHAGDLTRWGDPEEWKEIIPWLGELPHEKKYFIPGNHDFHMQLYPGPALQQLRELGVTVVGLPGNSNYETVELPNGMKMLGLPFVTELPRWAFNTTEDALNIMAARYMVDKIDIIVSHSPPRGILDRELGIRAYTNKFLPWLHPKVWISGHIHERYGAMEKNGTRFYNVCMCNRKYEHANAPMVIDV